MWIGAAGSCVRGHAKSQFAHVAVPLVPLEVPTLRRSVVVVRSFSGEVRCQAVMEMRKGISMESARGGDVIAAYRMWAAIGGAGIAAPPQDGRLIIGAHRWHSPAGRGRNFDQVRDLVAQRVDKTSGRISAKRLLPQARAAGYAGSARNFRRLVASAKAEWRQGQHRGRRPGVWAPAETLLIDWGVQAGVHVFCAVLAWSRFRFVRFAADEKAATTLALLAECFETLGGAPKTVLADDGLLRPGLSRMWWCRPRFVRFAPSTGSADL